MKKILITGGAGFIGSNLCEYFISKGEKVVCLDNFATGHQRNLDEVETLVTAEQWQRFKFISCSGFTNESDRGAGVYRGFDFNSSF